MLSDLYGDEEKPPKETETEKDQDQEQGATMSEYRDEEAEVIYDMDEERAILERIPPDGWEKQEPADIDAR